MLGEVVAQRLAAHGLDDHADPVGVDAVLPDRAGIVDQRRADALLHPLKHVGEILCGAVLQELLVDEVVAAACRVSHQLADGRLRLGRAQHGLVAVEAVEHLELAELGHDRRHRRVEVDATLLDELQRRGGRDGLGHRRVAEHRVGPGVSGCALVEDAVAADHRGGDAVQRPIGGHAVQQVVDSLKPHVKLLRFGDARASSHGWWARRRASDATSSRGTRPGDRLDLTSDAGGARQACVSRHPPSTRDGCPSGRL